MSNVDAQIERLRARVKSLSLTKVLEAIHEKLENACQSVYDRHHKMFGRGKAVAVARALYT